MREIRHADCQNGNNHAYYPTRLIGSRHLEFPGPRGQAVMDWVIQGVITVKMSRFIALLGVRLLTVSGVFATRREVIFCI